MKWYDKEITLKSQPPEATAKLVGTYDRERHPSIQVDLVIKGISLTLYSHNPTGLVHETPTSDEVKDRYLQKVLKLTAKLEASTFADVLSRFPE